MGIGVTELLVILVIVALLFGTKKLRTIGTDLGEALRGFRKAMSEPEETKAENRPDEARIIEGSTASKDDVQKP
jgi:sec-independent protein translocase protein TatA